MILLMILPGMFNTTNGCLEGSDDHGNTFAKHPKLRQLMSFLSLFQCKVVQQLVPRLTMMELPRIFYGFLQQLLVSHVFWLGFLAEGTYPGTCMMLIRLSQKLKILQILFNKPADVQRFCTVTVILDLQLRIFCFLSDACGFAIQQMMVDVQPCMLCV